jgi:hypothetical protein
VNLADQFVWFAGNDYATSQPLFGIRILPTIPKTRENERGSIFHFDRIRNFPFGRFLPFLKAVGGNQTSTFVKRATKGWGRIDLRQAERVKNHLAYQRFKARRTPEGLRGKWREAKAAQRAAAAAARAEAEGRSRRDEELAAKAAALAADAERERKSREPLAESGNKVELEIVRIPANPRLLICAYLTVSGERRCIVRVGLNANFRRGMKLVVKRPVNGAEAEPWAYDGSTPRRPGHW